MMRENLRKRFPDESKAQIDERMADWLAGPDPTDVDLRVIPWPR